MKFSSKHFAFLGTNFIQFIIILSNFIIKFVKKTIYFKVWLDYKSYVKQKLSANKAESKATGGGRNKMQVFTDIEETVIAKSKILNKTKKKINILINKLINRMQQWNPFVLFIFY